MNRVGKSPHIHTIQSTNQPTNPKNETQINPMSIISRCYSNCFVGFFTYLLGWLLTHPPRRIVFNKESIKSTYFLMAKKRTINFFFFKKNWNYYHRSSIEHMMGTKQKSFSPDILLESDLCAVENVKIEQNHAKIENYVSKS